MKKQWVILGVIFIICMAIGFIIQSKGTWNLIDVPIYAKLYITFIIGWIIFVTIGGFYYLHCINTEVK